MLSMPRALTEVPDAPIGPDGSIAFGSYRGGFRRIDLRPLAGRVGRLLRQKRWYYALVVQGPYIVSVAAVDVGYAANAFVHVYDARSKAFVVDRSSLGLRTALRVGDLDGARFLRFGSRKLHVSIETPRGSTCTTVRAEAPGVLLLAELESAAAPPAITAVALIPGGVVNVTEKRALLTVRGSLKIADSTHSLDGALAAYDATHGLLARRTRWHWGFALGRDRTGAPFALNLVEGFVGEPECAAFADGDVHALPEARFTFDRRRPLEPWIVRTEDGSVDLRFVPGAAVTDDRNLGLVRSRFVQPSGAWHGTVRLAHRTVELDGVAGVVEDQELVW